MECPAHCDARDSDLPRPEDVLQMPTDPCRSYLGHFRESVGNDVRLLHLEEGSSALS